MNLSKSDVNHLRRLLGWIKCDIGQSPEEMVATIFTLATKLEGFDVSEEGKQRLLDSYKKSDAVPKYVRAAVKALADSIKDEPGEIVDAEISEQRKLN